MLDNHTSVINSLDQSSDTALIKGVLIFSDDSCLISKHFTFGCKVVTFAIIPLIPSFDTIFVNDIFDPFELFRREDKSTTKAVFLRDTVVNSSVLVYADDFSITIDNSTTRQTRYRSCLISDASSSFVIIRINGFYLAVSFIELASYDRLFEFF